MKKTIIATLALMGAFVASADSYLYWLSDVNDSAYDYGKNYTASVRASDGGYLNLYSSNGELIGTSISYDAIQSGMDWGTGFYALATDVTSGSFFVEILAENQVIATSDGLDYASATSLGYLSQNGIGAPGQNLWTAQVTLPIPEPNSGLLMLIGCALLGLRRKQKKA